MYKAGLWTLPSTFTTPQAQPCNKAVLRDGSCHSLTSCSGWSALLSLHKCGENLCVVRVGDMGSDVPKTHDRITPSESIELRWVNKVWVKFWKAV